MIRGLVHGHVWYMNPTAETGIDTGDMLPVWTAITAENCWTGPLGHRPGLAEGPGRSGVGIWSHLSELALSRHVRPRRVGLGAAAPRPPHGLINTGRLACRAAAAAAGAPWHLLAACVCTQSSEPHSPIAARWEGGVLEEGRGNMRVMPGFRRGRRLCTESRMDGKSPPDGCRRYVGTCEL